MIKAVLDTNVLVSGAVERNIPSAPRTIMKAWLTEYSFDLVISEHIIEELRNAFKDPWFAKRLRSFEIGKYINLIRSDATVVPLVTRVAGVATHTKDDLVIATAKDGKARYIVTRDKPFQSVSAKTHSSYGIEGIS